jgi:hypothetical protein
MNPTVLLVDEAQVDACFGPFGKSANLNARFMHGLRLKASRPLELVSAIDDNTTLP